MVGGRGAGGARKAMEDARKALGAWDGGRMDKKRGGKKEKRKKKKWRVEKKKKEKRVKEKCREGQFRHFTIPIQQVKLFCQIF